jgi:hypothetical protein
MMRLLLEWSGGRHDPMSCVWETFVGLAGGRQDALVEQEGYRDG